MKKRLLSFVLAVLMIASLLPATALAADVVDSGTCGAEDDGSNLTWTLDSEGVLTISGSGDMYDLRIVPWDYRSRVKSAVIAEGVTSIGRSAFWGCTSLTSVTIPDSVTSIGEDAFDTCSSLTNVTIPNGVTSIEEHTFDNCKSLTSVTIPNSVTSIGDHAFYDCTSLTSVTIPNSVTSIGDAAFASCTSLTGIWVAEGNSHYANDASGVLFNKDKTTLVQCPGAFAAYTIPNSVTSINKAAFSYCTSLTGVTIPDSVTSIGGSAFRGCSSLTSVTIPDSVTSIGEYAFYDCTSLTSVTIPDSVTSIGENAFYGCTSLTSVTIPDSVTSIGDWAFSWCTSLISVTIPNSVTSIGEHAFYYCKSLTSVTIPDSVTSIGSSAFENCTSLTSVTIPNSVTSIDYEAFHGCESLTSVTIPDSVTSIGEQAFAYCTSLTSVTIPDSVTSIGWYAFDGCKSLTSVTIPDSVTSIGGCAFRYCTSLTGIWVAEGNSHYSSDASGALFDKNMTDLIQCPGRFFGAYTIPDSVASIGAYAFSDCTSLTSVTIPTSVTSIGRSAFEKCTSLTSVTIPDSVTSIGDDAFCDCTSLTSVTIPDSVTSIGGTAFYDCGSLTSVTIPSSVTSIGDWVFGWCTSLTSVTIPDSVTSIGEYAFADCTSLTDVYYAGSEAQWKAISISSTGNDDLLTANIHYYFVDPGSYRSIYGADAQERALTVYGNKNDSATIETNYQALPGVEVSGDVDKRTTGADGKATLQNDGGSVTFHKDGYVDRTLSAAALNVSADVYLQKTSDYPVINAVWLNDVNDVMNTRYPMNLVQSKRYKVEAEISWGSSSAKRVILYQGDKSYDITAGASSLVLSDRFDLSKALYIAATDQKDHTTVKKLKLESGSAATAALDGAKIDFGDSLKFTLPDSIPVIGGDSLKLGLYSQVPFKAVVDKGKVYVAIGYQVDADQDGVKSFANSAKKLRDNMAKAKTEAQKYKTMQDARKAFGGKAATVGGSWGFDAGFTVMGFAEGWYDDDAKIHWTDGGITLGANVGVDYSYPFAIGPVPCYAEVGFTADFQARLNLLMNADAKKFMPSGTLKGDIALDIGAGVGVAKVITAGGGAKGKLSPTMNFDAANQMTSADAKFSLAGYLKVTALDFTYKHPFDPWVDKLIWQYPDPADSADLMSADGQPNFIDQIYNAANYTAPDLSYLEKGSEFFGAKKPGLFKRLFAPAEFLSETENPVFLSNAYEQAQPELVTWDDGTMLAVWKGYDSKYSGLNALALYYSYYNGSKWSTPEILEQDGTLDGAFTLQKINGSAYVLWQDAGESVSDDITLDELSQKMGLNAASFNAAQQTFSVQTVAAASGAVSMLPTICGDAEHLTAVWATNTEGDVFGQNSANAICTSTYSNGSWSAAETSCSGLNSIDSLAAAYDESGTLQIAYSVDADGDPKTIDDMEVYRNGTALTDNGSVDSGVVYRNGTLYWFSNGALMAEGKTVVSADRGLMTDRYRIVDENGVKAVLFTQNSGLYASLYGIFYDSDSGEWGQPVALTDGSDFVTSFSAGVAKDGKLKIMANRQQVTGTSSDENPYGESSLQLLEIAPGCQLKITDTYYDGGNYLAGEDLPVTLTVTNAGQAASNGVKVQFYDGSKLLYEQTFDGALQAGAITTMTATPAFDKAEQDRALTVKVIPADAENDSAQGGSTTITLHQNDLTVEYISWGLNENGKVMVYADVVNRGYSTSKGVTVSLRKSAVDGDVVDSVALDTLGTLGLQHVSFETDGTDGDLFYITLDGKAADDNGANDADFVVIRKEKANACQHNYEQTTIAAECERPGYIIMTCSSCGDSYVQKTLAELGHDYLNGTCTRCGQKEGETPHKHSYKDIVTAPTCTEKGYTTHTCACGDSYVDTYVDALGHAWDNGKVTKDPTATETGVRTYTCTRCGETKTEIIPKLTHEHSYTAVVTPPTCTEKGYTTHTCACGDSYVDTYVDALGHAWDSGTVTKQPTATETGVRTYTCTRCHETKTETIPATGSVDVTQMFTDVTKNWAYPGIQYCVTHGIMGGMGDGTFAPTGTTTRAQIVQILYNLEGTPAVSGTTPFTDLTANWYKPAILWAYQNNVVAGTSPTTFDPDQPVTREQIAVILTQYMFHVLKMERTWTPADLSKFPDGAQVSGWAKEAMQDAVALGLINGTKAPDGKVYLDPQGSAARQQVATILMNFCQNVKK